MLRVIPVFKGGIVNGKSILVTAVVALVVVIGYDQYKARKAG